MSYLSSAPNAVDSGFDLVKSTQAGGKADGLLKLPPAWYPPTIIISQRMHDSWRSSPGHSIFDESSILGDLERACNFLGKESGLIARSNAQDESLDLRGRYESLNCNSDVDNLVEAIAGVWSAGDVLDGQKSPIGIVLQPQLHCSISGHLSNEHRISRDNHSWTLEIDRVAGPETRRWRVSGDEEQPDGPLVARTLNNALATLRSVAKRLSMRPGRFHLEWVWDGKRLWIVQADQAPRLLGLGPGDNGIPPIGSVIDSDSLAWWKKLDRDKYTSELCEWKKISARSDFEKIDLPVVSMWQLSGKEIIQLIAEGKVPEDLENDIRLLASTFLIVRTDVRNGHEGLMRKMTQSNNSGKIIDFLRASVSELITEGVEPESICFLAHRYIAARGCAWTYSDPESSRVIIDSTWGLLDGLSWLPHDTTIVDTATRQSRRSIGGKTTIFDSNASDDEGSADWQYRDTPTEWIWRSSLSDDQLYLVANGAKRLADLKRKPVITMWFIGLLDDSPVDCLPWFIAPSLPDFSKDVKLDGKKSREMVVRRSDVDRIRSLNLPPGTVLSIRPSADLIRDKNFVDDIIDLSKLGGFTIEIIGSPLAHPFYLFQSAGIPVVCKTIGELDSTQYAKLVRDGIPEIIRENGESSIVYESYGSQKSRLFRSKVVEEALELLAAESEKQTIEEMADLLEIVEALRLQLKIPSADLRRVRKEKLEARGGFNRGLVLVSTGHAGNELLPNQEMLPGLDKVESPVEPWKIKRQNGSLIVSCVPPAPGQSKTFMTSLSGSKVEVTYTSSGVQFTIVEKYEDEQDSIL